LNQGIVSLMPRRGEFRSDETMVLAGTAMYGPSREYLVTRLDEVAHQHRSPPFGPAGEVIIGAGLHAGIIAAARVRAGYPKPIVLEDSAYAGGNFAMTNRPAFYLNSSNVPGLIGTPEYGEALNYLPGAPIQPSEFGFSDFQVNSDVGLAVKLMLARYARVFTSSRVVDVTPGSNGIAVSTAAGTLTAQRVYDARGLGDEIALATPNGRNLMTFRQFMRHADTPFPFRGMRRAAVIGGGAGGKVTVEALLGIGPMSAMETASLDFIQRVDWYGTGIPEYGSDWRLQSQRRYARIGTYLPERPDSPDYEPTRAVGNTRLTVIPGHGTPVVSTDNVLVNSQSYDTVIMTVGYRRPDLGPPSGEFSVFKDLAMRHEHYEIYRAGPAASLPFSESELAHKYATNPSNALSIFRMANRSAALGTSLAPVIM
jgi:hypothetical protein